MTLRNLQLLLAAAACAAADPWEWAGIFETSGTAPLTWTSQRAKGNPRAWADPKMKIVVLATPDATDARLTALHAEARHGFAATCTDVDSGGTVTPTDDACFELHFDSAGAGDHTFSLNVASATHVAVFTAHLPSEFEHDIHYLRTAAGANVEPVATQPAAGDPHAGHDHGAAATASPFEWAGVFETPGGVPHTWTSQAVGTPLAFKDPTMKIVVLNAAEADAASLAALEAEAGHGFAANCTVVSSGGTIAPTEDACFELTFGPGTADFTATITTVGVPHLAIFTAHYPTEFERDTHYLARAGVDVEPVATLPLPAATRDRWGVAMGAGILVNLCTLVGVAFLVPAVSRAAKAHPRMFSTVANAFAAGALLACTFFLLLFEATHLIAVGPTMKEAAMTGAWGAFVLFGFLVASIIDLFVSPLASLAGKRAASSSTDMEKAGGEVVGEDPGARQVRVLSGILVGDFVHNLCDGIFIGTGFRACNDTIGWSIAAATIYHEIAQEVSDYIVLTDPKQGGLKPLTALICNFLSGTSVLLGIIIILAQDKVDDRATGYLLAFSGGVYVQIGAAECMAKAYANAVGSDTLSNIKIRLALLISFCIGAAAIGVVLLDHEHCVPAGTDAHAGHNH